jgi:hypothetical protein
MRARAMTEKPATPSITWPRIRARELGYLGHSKISPVSNA